MKYLLQADWERLVKNAERYEALAHLVGANDPDRMNVLMGLPRAHIDKRMDAELERQSAASRRTSGDSICKTCSLEYRKHPRGGPIGCGDEQFLNRLCDGGLVKL